MLDHVGSSSGQRQLTGVVSLGGLLSSTSLNMLVVPVLYRLWDRAPERAPPRVRSSHDGARFRGTRSGRRPRLEICPLNATNSWTRSGQDRFNEGETSDRSRATGR